MEKESRQLLSLIHSLNQPDKRALRQAVDALISTAPRFPHLARELECLLAEKPGTENWPVAYVLAHISSPSPLCLRVLGETLGATDPDIRWAVVLLLVRLAKQNARIVGLLFDLLKSGAPIQRRMALYCLRDTEADETAILQALLESLRDPDPLVRVAAVNSLKNRADIGRDGLDRLLDVFLRDADLRVRRTTALVLAHLGAPTGEILAALEYASTSRDPHLKKAAEAALALLKKRARPLLAEWTGPR
ncbi:MAG: HEAT repeat domain-containing protein [Deltaproteobacteria bacterium]|nr:HEAT repeat domain-containing protein [Deltaproteobacteria bacterium]MBI3063133.1 HEAT repeat domain-containing protein [Deltaproteobacteria bacterium]